jgi:integrase
MASIFKPAGKSRYVIVYVDETGRRRKKVGATDKVVTQRIANDIENRLALKREGIVSDQDEAYARHAALALVTHIDAWTETLRSRGLTPQHVKLHSSRAMRVVALIKGADLAKIEAPRPATRKGVAKAEAELRRWVGMAKIGDLTTENVQTKALLRLREDGRSLQTLEHHRNAIRALAIWLHDTHRVREPLLRGLKGYSVKEDPRHERRTVSVAELRRLIEAAAAGKPFRGMTGAQRALCYRLAVASGLRYTETDSITPESFDWSSKPAAVTIKAGYAKNGQTARLSLPDDLAADLAAYVRERPPGEPIFPLPKGRGAEMVKKDLKAAGIPYRDAAGRVFDYHSLRCELATLADAAGVSPRVVQTIMRHSKLEMTGRYTRPRAVDIEAAAGMLSSLAPATKPDSEPLAMTGTDSGPVSLPGATSGATSEGADGSNCNPGIPDMANGRRSDNPFLARSARREKGEPGTRYSSQSFCVARSRAPSSGSGR